MRERSVLRRGLPLIVAYLLLSGCAPSHLAGSAEGAILSSGATSFVQVTRETLLVPLEEEALSSLVDPEEAIRDELAIVEDYRVEFSHGEKGAAHQRYIVLHDTEGGGTPESVVSYWDGADNGVAAHFVIGKDGHVVQCVPLDEIAHHAGYGDTGHNQLFGVEDESRDDFVGTVPIGDWAADYGMNSHSVGIELIHIGGEGDYPEAQLEALDRVIALIDAHYGFESDIIDHKAWRTGNSDTSAEFAGYLANYQMYRTHRGEAGE